MAPLQKLSCFGGQAMPFISDRQFTINRGDLFMAQLSYKLDVWSGTFF
jgi:hypothetical protein